MHSPKLLVFDSDDRSVFYEKRYEFQAEVDKIDSTEVPALVVYKQANVRYADGDYVRVRYI
jgi:hypothetical protein